MTGLTEAATESAEAHPGLAAGKALSGLTAEAADTLSGLALSGALTLFLTLSLLSLLSLTLSASCALHTLSGLALSGGCLGKEHSHCQGERSRQTDES